MGAVLTRGATLVELLIAMVVFSVILGILGTFMSLQSRSVALTQAINEAEITARTVAEMIAQELQIAGARAVRIGSTAQYEDIDRDGCNENDRRRCVIPVQVEDGVMKPWADPGSIDGYSFRYRTSLDVEAPNCRRVDVVLVGARLFRQDEAIACPLVAFDADDNPVDSVTRPLDSSFALFAERISAFGVSFVCSDDDEGMQLESIDPGDCYEAGGHVVQARVNVTATSLGREARAATVQMLATMPNMRPSVTFFPTRVE